MDAHDFLVVLSKHNHPPDHQHNVADEQEQGEGQGAIALGRKLTERIDSFVVALEASHAHLAIATSV